MNTLSVADVGSVTHQNANNYLLEISETMPNEQMPDWAFTISAAVLFLIGFFGFFLNLFVIILMCKDTQVSKILLHSCHVQLDFRRRDQHKN